MDKQSKDKSKLLVKLFEGGRQFTMNLLKENERLRLLLAAQKVDSVINKKPGETVSDHLVKLESEIKRYQTDLEQIRHTLSDVEVENQKFMEEYLAVEQQNATLTNLYVAIYRLHSTLDLNEVMNIIKEIVINQIGSEMFGIFLKDEKNEVLKLLAHEGLEEEKINLIPIGVGIVGQAAERGESYYAEKKEAGGEPIACVPLKIQDQLIGMIVIYQLLQQKSGFSPLDFELFSLMADHAATALYCSQLHTSSEKKLNTLKDLLENFKMKK